MKFKSDHSRSYKRTLLGMGAAMAVFGAGFALSPADSSSLAQREAARLLAAAPGAQVGLLAPLPEESETTVWKSSEANPSMPPVETYTRVMDQLEESYYMQTPSEREMTYAAIRGMLASLGDRFTRFLDPDEYRRMNQENKGEFGGIGATLEKLKGKTIVKELIPNAPAQKSGLKPGDAILFVEDKPTDKITLVKVVDLIRGEVGKPVKLTVERTGVAKPFVKSIVRDVVKLPILEAKMLTDENKKPNGIAHISLGQFNAMAHEELDRAMDKMSKQGMRALIFDLRGNPGGYLSEAIEVGSRFLESGPVVILQQRGGERQSYNVLKGSNINRAGGRYKVPLVVLVDKGSASASEIVSGAVKDTNSGIIVGTDTFGKGLVQSITPIRNDGSAVLITTQKYLTPNGTDINKKGISPHVKVTVTKEDIEKKRDPQLAKAVSILKGEMIGGVTAKARPRN